MVNKKLTNEQEDEIYLEYLSGKSMTKIKENYPVVISTIQRIISRKSRNDGFRNNLIFPKISKSLHQAVQPLRIALKIIDENTEPFFEKQTNLILEDIKKMKEDLESLEKRVISETKNDNKPQLPTNSGIEIQ